MRTALCFGVAASFLTGCVTTGAHPAFSEAHPKIKKVALIPPEIIVGHMTDVSEGERTKRLLVRNEDREAIYRQSVTGDQALLFGTKGYQIDQRLVALFEEGKPEFTSHYLSFVRDYEYAAANATLPASTGGQATLEANVQKALKPLAQYTDADAFIFTRFGRVTWDPTSTTQQVLTAALFGFITHDDKTAIDIVCIERNTGRLLWRTSFSTYQDYFVHMKRVVDEFPDSVRAK